jgi:sec-independent protein translocase protein TatA
MPSIGGQELIVIFLIVMIIFGAGRLPEIGGAFGKSIKEFRTSAGGSDDQPSIDAPPVVSASAKPEARPLVALAARADDV